MFKSFSSLITGILLISIIGCSKSTLNVVKVNKKDIEGKNGYYYALPQTAITVDVTMKKIEKVKGPYYEYAEKFLGLTNYIKNNSTTYEISKFEIGSYVQPDTLNYYLIEAPNIKKPFYLQLDESGIIKSLNIKNHDTTELRTGSPKDMVASSNPENFISLSMVGNVTQKVDTVIEKIVVDTSSVSVVKKVYKKSFVEKSLEEKAKEASNLIIKIKEKKFGLITGDNEVNYNPETLEFLIKELDKAEKDYLQLFTGLTVSTTIKKRIVYVPSSAETLKPPVLFRFSQNKGILPVRSDEGEKISIGIDRCYNTRAITDCFNTKHANKTSRHGIFYRIPDMTKVSISYNDIKEEQYIPVAQYGVVMSLPNKNYKIQFYPNTGAIKSIGTGK
ncbi:MAG: DUF4831 family protein [Bacteroidota bacterium]|nr:DUF4831 family protein [Bacteroidota bacterium]